MEEEWNMNISDGFNISFINVLDKSMMKWFNKYATGFMCVGRKLHTFGNTRHIICFGLSSILWISKISEGKYRPLKLGQKE